MCSDTHTGLTITVLAVVAKGQKELKCPTLGNGYMKEFGASVVLFLSQGRREIHLATLPAETFWYTPAETHSYHSLLHCQVREEHQLLCKTETDVLLIFDSVCRGYLWKVVWKLALGVSLGRTSEQLGSAVGGTYHLHNAHFLIEIQILRCDALLFSNNITENVRAERKR